jgi:hypothetical protein
MFFWPEILQIWFLSAPFRDIAPKLFQEILPYYFLGSLNLGSPTWNPTISFNAQFSSFWQSIRYNLVPLLGVLATWITWQRHKKWKTESDYRIAVFLSVLFISLFMLHFWASILRNSCVYCFGGYLTFFSPLGLVLLALAWPHLHRELTKPRRIVVVIIVLAISAGIGYAATEIFPWGIVKPVWVIFWNKFGFSSRTDFDLVEKNLWVNSSIFTGMLVGIIVLLLPRVIQRVSDIKKLAGMHNIQVKTLSVMLLAGLLFSPFNILSRDVGNNYCGSDVIASHEEIGSILSDIIVSGTQVFWAGGNSPALMLYIPKNDTYPGLLNGAYSSQIGGDADDLLKMGFRNKELEAIWLEEADYLLLIDRRLVSLQFELKNWREIVTTPPADPCLEDSAIHIFAKIEVDQ